MASSATAAPIHLTDVVKRPDVGTAGNRIQVRTNFFEVLNLPNINVHHYDVTITPDVPPPVNRKIFAQFVERHRVSDLKGVRPVYDGRKNMFSAKALPFDSKTFEIVLPGDVSPHSKNPTPSFKVKIKKAAEINLEELSRFLKGKSALSNNCLTAIMALDVLIHHEPAMLYQTVGRSFFTPNGCQPLSGGLDVWRGYYQSIRPTAGKMMVNVDVSATAFFQSIPLTEMAVKILDLRSADDLRRSSLNWRKVEKMIKGLRIKATHRQLSPSKTFKIFGLTRTSARDTVFKQLINGEGPKAEPVEVETNVADYFQEAYKLGLKYPMLPCVIVGRTAMLPLEVCFVVEGQRYQKKLDERQTADMIKFTCQPPTVRANNIRDGLRILKYDRNDYLKDFGLKVSSEMATIQARVLAAPTINYNPTSREPNIRPQFGAWNLINKKVLRGAKLSSWGVIVFGTEQHVPKAQVNAFVRELVVTCNDTGMNIVNKTPPVMYGNPQGDIEAALRDIWTRAGNAVKLKPELIMCILPTTGVPLYAEIKRVTDTVLGISSQCIQVRHTREAKKQYCANVCLKMNVKLGGINSQLAARSMPFLEDRPTIFFGADVTHPGPGDTTRPSIACLTASMDGKAARYAAAVRTQTARQETMADLAEMTEELLRAFYISNKVKPERILFYRDGVAEGQFAEVMRVEVAALKQAFAKLDATYAPKLTFVVVQKRHHARFFPMKREDGDRSGNCLPGTVVDTGITHPFEFDFYLQSHAGLLGTSRPAHYCVLHDENKFKADQLQDISYKLCHLYARCTRTVSMVPPAYYAHLIAARARFHARGENWSDSYSTDTTLSDGPAYARVPKSLTGVMWFM